MSRHANEQALNSAPTNEKYRVSSKCDQFAALRVLAMDLSPVKAILHSRARLTPGFCHSVSLTLTESVNGRINVAQEYPVKHSYADRTEVSRAGK